MKIQFIFKFSNRISIEIWKSIFICCVVGSPIFFVWGLMCLRFDVSGVWRVWSLTCLRFEVSGVVNGTILSFFFCIVSVLCIFFSILYQSKARYFEALNFIMFEQLQGVSKLYQVYCLEVRLLSYFGYYVELLVKIWYNYIW